MLTIKSSLLLVFLTLLSSCKFSKTAIDDALGIFTITYSEQAPTYLVNTPITANVPNLTAKSSATFSVSPALPNGLSLDPATGVISGTPTVVTAQAAYTIVGVSSSPDSETAVAVVVIKVDPEAPSDLQTSATTFTLVKNIAMTPMTSSVSTGSPVTYSITPSLPAGLTLNSTTGTISGTPTVVSPATNYVLKATNVSGDMTIVLSFEVQDIAVASLSYTSTSANYTINTLISANIPSTTGGSATSFSISPALPAGISLNTVSGVISGTPTALSGSTNYTVTATNSQGSATTTISIQVTGVAPSGLSYTSSSLEFTKNTAITSLTPTVSGIVTGFTVNPALPAGLSLNASTGVISGTPTAVTSSATYNIRANNGSGYAAFDMTIVVKDIAPSTLTYSANPVVYTVGSLITNNTPSSSGGAVVSYSVSPGLPAGLSFNTSTGVISGTPSAVAGSANYTVTATNTGGSTTASVAITVNAGAPSGLSYSANPAVYTLGSAITSNSPSSSGGAVVSYSISPSLPAGLSLDTSTGVISGTPSALATIANYTVTATNSGGSTTASVSITVNAVAPSALSYTSPNTFTVGSSISSLSPTVTGTITSYSISPALPAGLSLNTSTGVISGTPSAVSATANYTVTATNSGGSTTFAISITVNAVSPNSLTYSTSPAIYTVGSAITDNTPSISGSVISYSVSPALPAGLSLDTSTGVISGTPSAITATANYTVTATNSGGSTTASVAITVNAVTPSSLTYSTNPATYTVGSVITDNSPSSSGGAVVSYSVAPALPAGLSLNTSTGVISGTPSAVAANASYTVTATNSGGSTTASVAITVNAIAPSGLTYLTNPATYTVGSVITNNTPSSYGGAVVSYSISPALPAGLSLNTSTGVISGTPSAVAANASYTVTATNSGGSTTATVAITVNAGAPSTLTYSSNPATYTAGSVITDNTPSSNGGAIVSYSVSPALPAGLSLNTSTGVISGTPSAVTANASYTVTATNSGGSTTASVAITVNAVAPSGLTYSTNPASYTVGSAISNNSPSVTGTIVSYSVSPALPAGLSFNTSTGVISGTPSAATSAANYTVTATNSGGSTTAAVNIAVLIAAPSGLTYSTNPATYVAGSAITTNSPTITGSSLTYSVSPSLPSGLSLNTSTGAITGTPSATTAAANYVVTATNSSGSTTATVSITVNPAAPTSLSYSTNPATYVVGSAITTNSPTVTGTVSSYSVSPALPAGLSLNITTGNITGTPSGTAAVSSYTVTATNVTGSTTASVSITVNPAAPTNLTYSTNPASYVAGSAITNNTPTVTGTVASYSVSPSLPTGLSLNTTTGVISGTPTTVTATANYTVTATNVTGSTTRAVSITITLAAPSSLTYSTNPASYSTGSAITNNTPTSSGGAVASYSVSPALPTGLSLNTTTGVISGTPTVATAAANYTVTATNATGSTTRAVNITVVSGGTAPSSLSYSGTNIINGCSVSLSPTVTGTPTSYSTSGAFQTGLSFNTTTGVISGTPSASGSTTRTITATNASGSTTASVTIVVSDSTISYSWTEFNVQGTISQTPTVTGLCGTADTFTLTDGTLPRDLTLDSSTGEISGTQLTGIYGQRDSFSITVSHSGEPLATATESLSVTRKFAPVLTDASRLIDSYIEQFNTHTLVTVSTDKVTITPVLDGSGTSFFNTKVTTTVRPLGGLALDPTYSTSVTADFNDDGMKDLAAIDSTNQAIHFFSFNSTSRAFEWDSTIYNSFSDYDGDTVIKAGEIDGSGLIDLVVMSQRSGNYSLESFNNRGVSGDPISLALYSSGFRFYNIDGATPLTTYSPIPMILFDSNGDGIDEMAIFDERRLFYYNDLSTIRNGQVPDDAVSLTNRANLQSVSAADFNKDRREEIVLIQTGYISAFNFMYDPGKSELQNEITATLTSLKVQGTSQSSLTVIDIDADGSKDLAFYDFTASKASLVSVGVDMSKGQFQKINQQIYQLNLPVKSTGIQNCLNEFTSFSYDGVDYFGLIGCFEKSAYPLSLQPL